MFNRSPKFEMIRRHDGVRSRRIHTTPSGGDIMPGTTRNGPGAATTPLDDVDRRIVAELLADGRISVNELATRVGVSRATAYSRLDRLRSDGVITGFTAVVDPAKVGHGVAALILVNVEQNQWRRARDELLRLPGVEYLAFTSGGFDMVALVRVESIEALRDVVLDRLHGATHVRSTQTVFVLDEQRRQVPLP
jgi:DNA-binding Lrp family transcriptional regulator